MATWEISGAAVDLVKRFEGKRLNAYKDPVGIVTIGYGYTNRAGFGPGVKMGDTWTEQQAEDMLREGLERFAAKIQPHFTRKPNADQFGAFVSLAYNIGIGGFIKSTALKRWNAGDIAGAAEAVTWWNKAGGKVLRGLVRRRDAEARLILGQPEHADAAVEPQKPRETIMQSTTQLSVIGAGLATAAQMSDAAKDIVGDVSETFGVSPSVVLGVAAIAFLAWINRERLRRWQAGDR